MTYPRTSAYIAAYTTARSSLAALAGLASGEDACRFEHVLAELDQLHDGDFPAAYPLIGTRGDMLLWLEGAIEYMIALGGDALSLERMLVSALDS